MQNRGFKPCAECPDPAACKAAGKCMLESSRGGRGRGGAAMKKGGMAKKATVKMKSGGMAKKPAAKKPAAKKMAYGGMAKKTKK